MQGERKEKTRNYDIEFLKRIVDAKSGLTDGEKRYIVNRVTNAIRKTKSECFNNLQIAIINHERVNTRYREEIILRNGMKVTIGFDYD